MIYFLALSALTQLILVVVVIRNTRATRRAEAFYLETRQFQLRLGSEVSATLDSRLSETNLCISNLESLAQKASELSELDAKLAIRRKKMENPSETLRDFLQDLADGGCGIVRIDPQAVFIRGIRG